MAQVWVAYLLWLIPGGFHLLYLGRDIHAALSFCTLEFFFFGKLNDLFAIPQYVREANNQLEFQKFVKDEQSLYKVPPTQLSRVIGMGVFGFYLSKLFGVVASGFPQPIPTIVCALGAATGVCLVGCMGRKKSNFKYVYGAALLAALAKWHYSGSASLTPVIVAEIVFQRYRTWAPRRDRSKLVKFLRYAGIITVHVLLWVYMLWNIEVTLNSKQGKPQSVKLGTMFKNMVFYLASDFGDAFNEFTDEMGSEEAKKERWDQRWKRFAERMDATGQRRARQLLDVSDDADEATIKAAYKRLAKKYHPDKAPPDKKDEYREHFQEINEAYTLLTN